MKMGKEELFGPYRPYCSILLAAEGPVLPALQKLTEMTRKESNPEILDELQDYILFPMQVYLKDPCGNENYTIEILKFVEEFFSLVNLSSNFIYRDLFKNLLLLLTEKKSEDMRIHLTAVFASMIRSAVPEIKDISEDEKYKLQLSHLIFLCLEISSSEEEDDLVNEVVVGCLKVLDVIRENHEDLTAMTPGILSKLVKIMKRSEIRSKTIVLALRLWRNFCIEFLRREGEFANNNNNIKALNHIQTHLEVLRGFVFHEKEQVRNEMFNLCLNLDQDHFVEIRTEILANLSVIGTPTSNELLDRIFSELSEDRIKSVTGVWQSRLDDFTVENLDEELESKLIRLQSILLILNKLKPLCFYAESYTRPLVNKLIVISSLDLSKPEEIIDSDFDFEIIEEDEFNYDFVLDPEIHLRGSHLVRPLKSYRYLRKVSQINRFYEICRLLKPIDSILRILHRDLEEVEEDLDKMINLVNLINIFLEDDQIEIAETYLNINGVLLGEGKIKAKTSGDRKKLRLLYNSVAEGFGKLRGLDDYVPEFLTFIFSYCSDRVTIYFVLRDLSNGDNNISELLTRHLRALSQSLALQLRQMTKRRRRSPQLHSLLKLILKIPRFEEEKENLREIYQVLLCQLDLSWLNPDKSVTTDILKIINVLVHTFAEEKEEKQKSNNNLMETIKRNEENGAIAKLIRDLKASDEVELKFDDDLKCPEEGFHGGNDDVQFDNNEEEEEEDEEKKRELSYKQSFLKDCILHTRHFISMVKVPQWQLLALEIVARSIGIADLHEDELLPLVHQVWQPLKLLFDSDNIFVVDKAFELLRIFSENAGDFIQSRTLKEAFPPLLKYLRRLRSIVSDRENNKHSLIGRQASKLLEKIVFGLVDFLPLLQLDELKVDPILRQMLEYIDETSELSRDLEVFFKEGGGPKRPMDQDILYFRTKFIK